MSDTPAAFDPTRHLTKVSGRDYLEVKWRLVWLRDIYPDARVETELVMHHEGRMAVFCARVTLPGGGHASGWGQETSDDFGDYLEKAETKALGRALAALGFGTQFCPDHDFGADRQRAVDSPVDIRTGRAPVSAARNEATPRQVKYLYAVSRELGLSSDEVEARAQDGFGCTVAELSRRDVSALIEQICAGRPVQSTQS